MRVVLVHGMNRTRLSLARLAADLRRQGCTTETFGYVPAAQSFDAIVDRLADRLAGMPAGPWCAVGHSLGGLLFRAAIARLEQELYPVRLVQLGTPNRSPRLARRLGRGLLYRLISGDCGRLLADAGRMAAIPVPPVPITVVAGTGGLRGRLSPFGTDLNDGMVAVDETFLAGADVIELPVRHTFMMNHELVRRAVRARCLTSSQGHATAGSA